MLTWKNYCINLFLCNSSKQLMQCQLPYIPKRLHSFGKHIIEEFFIGEELYYRCKLGQCSKPYLSISLYDVSHNRNFNDSKLYPKEDVLFDINENTDIEQIENKDISISVIKSLSQNNTFEKEIISDDDPDIIVNIKLIHSPVPCMYSHCAFQISLKDDIITKENYSKTLGKKPKVYKNLRRDIRIELTSII
tara:strand:- start:1139 stop:1714 length:576 start_codon:yes stop_codon:yes gene_type:complete